MLTRPPDWALAHCFIMETFKEDLTIGGLTLSIEVKWLTTRKRARSVRLSDSSFTHTHTHTQGGHTQNPQMRIDFEDNCDKNNRRSSFDISVGSAAQYPNNSRGLFWSFNGCWIVSPSVEKNGNPKLPFCSEDACQVEEQWISVRTLIYKESHRMMQSPATSLKFWSAPHRLRGDTTQWKRVILMLMSIKNFTECCLSILGAVGEDAFRKQRRLT